jgi:hypothetical protein
MGPIQTVLRQKPSCHYYGGLAFLWRKKGPEMKNIKNTLTLSCFTRIIGWILILSITSPSWAFIFSVENRASQAIEPVKTDSDEEAVSIAKQYLNIENTKNYKIRIEEKVITANTFNTYRILKPGTNRLCWVVTFIAPDAVGAGRTVYVDRESGEILGGYSSK